MITQLRSYVPRMILLACIGGMLLTGQSATAGTAKAISSLVLAAQYDGNLQMFQRSDLTDGYSRKSGFGIHDETTSELLSFPETLWRLEIAASAFAVSPPTSRSVASFTEGAGTVFFVYNDPLLGLGDQTVKITFATATSLYAFAVGDYSVASAAASYSLTGVASREDIPILNYFPPVPFRITFPSIDGLNYAEEQSQTFVLRPGDAYQVSFGGATVAAAAYTSLVPEPASWTMLITGFGLIGCALRQRHRKSTSPVFCPIDLNLEISLDGKDIGSRTAVERSLEHRRA